MMAGKREKKRFPDNVQVRARLSVRDEKNIEENTRPHSAVQRIEILHGPSCHGHKSHSTGLSDCRDLRNVDERAL